MFNKKKHIKRYRTNKKNRTNKINRTNKRYRIKRNRTNKINRIKRNLKRGRTKRNRIKKGRTKRNRTNKKTINNIWRGGGMRGIDSGLYRIYCKIFNEIIKKLKPKGPIHLEDNHHISDIITQYLKSVAAKTGMVKTPMAGGSPANPPPPPRPKQPLHSWPIIEEEYPSKEFLPKPYKNVLDQWLTLTVGLDNQKVISKNQKVISKNGVNLIDIIREYLYTVIESFDLVSDSSGQHILGINFLRPHDHNRVNVDETIKGLLESCIDDIFSSPFVLIYTATQMYTSQIGTQRLPLPEIFLELMNRVAFDLNEKLFGFFHHKKDAVSNPDDTVVKNLTAAVTAQDEPGVEGAEAAAAEAAAAEAAAAAAKAYQEDVAALDSLEI